VLACFGSGELVRVYVRNLTVLCPAMSMLRGLYNLSRQGTYKSYRGLKTHLRLRVRCILKVMIRQCCGLLKILQVSQPLR
jgi:hypothetical protein